MGWNWCLGRYLVSPSRNSLEKSPFGAWIAQRAQPGLSQSFGSDLFCCAACEGATLPGPGDLIPVPAVPAWLGQGSLTWVALGSDIPLAVETAFPPWCSLKHQSLASFTVSIYPMKAWGKKKKKDIWNWLITYYQVVISARLSVWNKQKFFTFE